MKNQRCLNALRLSVLLGNDNALTTGCIGLIVLLTMDLRTLLGRAIVAGLKLAQYGGEKFVAAHISGWRLGKFLF
jgi:hypothetical protein